MIHFMTVETKENENGTLYNIDGYSDKKTVSGAVRDIGREISKIDEGEGRNLTEYAHSKEDAMNLLVPNVFTTDYCFELEEVGCATRYNQETDELEYENGSYYFHIRFTVFK